MLTMWLVTTGGHTGGLVIGLITGTATWIGVTLSLKKLVRWVARVAAEAGQPPQEIKKAVVVDRPESGESVTVACPYCEWPVIRPPKTEGDARCIRCKKVFVH